MKCPRCSTNLLRQTGTGHPIIHNRGMLIKALPSGGAELVLICPGCKGDVVPTPEVMKALNQIAILFFDKEKPATEKVVTAIFTGRKS